MKWLLIPTAWFVVSAVAIPAGREKKVPPLNMVPPHISTDKSVSDWIWGRIACLPARVPAMPTPM